MFQICLHAKTVSHRVSECRNNNA